MFFCSSKLPALSIDNTEHTDREIYIDRYYLEQDADDKDFTPDSILRHVFQISDTELEVCPCVMEGGTLT
jgi:hypothetical protein